MSKWYSDEVRDLFEAILMLEDTEECRLFFEDACTVKEIREIAQRFRVARLLYAKTSYADINRMTGVSTATISRVSRCLEYGSGGYEIVLNRFEGEKNGDR